LNFANLAVLLWLEQPF